MVERKHALLGIFVSIGLIYWLLNYNNSPGSIENVHRRHVIVAMGDSLTEGLLHFDSGKFHPYTLKLSTLVKSAGYSVCNAGKSGERVHAMYSRLSATVLRHDKIDDIKIVLILGGTNDIADLVRASNNSASDVAVRQTALQTSAILKSMHKLCARLGIINVVIKIPPVQHKGDWYPTFEKTRALVNKELADYAQTQNKPILTFDTVVESHLDDDSFWSDSVHYSSKGYDITGQFVYDSIKHFFLKRDIS